MNPSEDFQSKLEAYGKRPKIYHYGASDKCSLFGSPENQKKKTIVCQYPLEFIYSWFSCDGR
eukprot:UN08527